MSNPSDEQSYHHFSTALHRGTVVVKGFIWEMWTHLFRKRQRKKGSDLHFCNDLCFIEINYIKIVGFLSLDIP